MEKNDKILLVTGATGRQGGAVARHLLADGWKIRALTRHPDSPQSQALREIGCEIVQGDLSNPSSLDLPVRGAYGIFSMQQPREHGVDEEVRQGKNLADAAKIAGVQHFVYSSIGSAHEKTGIPHFESKAQIESHVRNLGLDYTIVRPVYFMENLLAPSIRDAIYNGTLSLALGPDIALQLIAVDDIGAFVALVFNDPMRYKGREIDIAGDELTGPQLADILTVELGREIKFKEYPLDKLHEESAESAMMFDWFNKRGYSANIPAIRMLVPDLERFDTWAKKSLLYKAAA